MMKTMKWALLLGVLLQVGTVYADDIFQLDLSDLQSVQVTSVAKKSQPLNEAAAAVSVISAEDIQRSGATSIPEALRLVPGVEVARIDANKWAVTIRGFNGRFANKLLVLLDGRTLYSQAFSGVLWHEKSVNLDDVEQIEVVRGPGAAVWGANAVNGVINIITKSAKRTQGGYLATRAGTEEQALATLRYGGTVGRKGFYRVYGQGQLHDDSSISSGDASDEWRQIQVGGRVDLYPAANDVVMLQGQIYRNKLDSNQVLQSLTLGAQSINEETPQQGGFFLGRWTHTTARDHTWVVQGSVELNDSDPEQSVDYFSGLAELEARYRLPIGRQDISLGTAYRHYWDQASDDFTTSFDPLDDNLNYYSLFVQDDIRLSSGLSLSLGARADYNQLSKWEWSASSRLAWQPVKGHTLWTALSRAVRSPSRGEESGKNVAAVIPGALPTLVVQEGNEDFEAETMLAVDAGYRYHLTPQFHAELAAFAYDYEHLRTIEVGTPEFMGTFVRQSLQVDNLMSGQVYGAEASVVWRVQPRWRLHANYSYLVMDLDLEADSNDPSSVDQIEGSSPTHRWSVRSSHDITERWQFDLWLKYAGPLATGNVDGYYVLDARLAWQPRKDLTLSLVGQNLLDSTHPEITPELLALEATEVDRGVYVQVDWRF